MSRPHRWAAAALLLTVLVPQAMAGPPTGLQGSYNDGTQVLTLSWTAPSGMTVEHYNVYRDGSVVAQTTSTSYGDNLSSWTPIAEEREYSVTAVPVGGSESGASNIVTVYRVGPGVPTVCGPVSVIVTTKPPDAEPHIHDECIPP